MKRQRLKSRLRGLLTGPVLVVTLKSVLRRRLGFAACSLAAIDQAGDTTDKAAKQSELFGLPLGRKFMMTAVRAGLLAFHFFPLRAFHRLGCGKAILADALSGLAQGNHIRRMK